MGAFDDFREYTPRSRGEWRRWLERNHASKPGVWLVYWKKGTGKQSLTYNDAVEEALCFGWIDSKIQPIDSERYRQVFTPRKARSAWSMLNKTRVARLEQAGILAEAGRRVIEQARADGSWCAWDAVESLEMPDDFVRALAADPVARTNFETYTVSWRKAVLRRISDAKRPETRARRIAEMIQMAASGGRPAGFPPKKSD
jgi:uncharacterized protein YdeI (YjbR/CyaY-like superfamily)